MDKVPTSVIDTPRDHGLRAAAQLWRWTADPTPEIIYRISTIARLRSQSDFSQALDASVC